MNTEKYFENLRFKRRNLVQKKRLWRIKHKPLKVILNNDFYKNIYLLIALFLFLYH